MYLHALLIRSSRIAAAMLIPPMSCSVYSLIQNCVYCTSIMLNPFLLLITENNLNCHLYSGVGSDRFDFSAEMFVAVWQCHFVYRVHFVCVLSVIQLWYASLQLLCI